MRFSLNFALSLLTLASAIALPEPEAESVDLAQVDFLEARDTVVSSPASPLFSQLERRACTYNGCRCNSRGKQLTACGACVWSDTGAYVVTTKRVLNHIFECSPTGNCCSYGYAKDCNTGSGRCKVYK